MINMQNSTYMGAALIDVHVEPRLVLINSQPVRIVADEMLMRRLLLSPFFRSATVAVIDPRFGDGT
jgi:hypothetical protein